MLSDPLFLLVVASIAVVVVVLIVGALGFSRGGEFNRKHGNRMMRYRVGAQLIAVVLLIIYAVTRGTGG